MTNLPFDVYDFFAYLASGAVVLTGLDVWMGPVILTGDPLGLYGVILAVLAAYILGQTTAQVSKPVLEDAFVHSILLPPSRVLMGEARPFLPVILRGYYNPLPDKIQSRISTRAKKQGLEKPKGDTLFVHAYGQVSQDKEAQARLDAFRNQYGFARNMCVALLFCAVAVTGSTGDITSSVPDRLPWVLLVFSVVMLYRFLKFYRQYSYQLLLTYAEMESTG